MEKKNLKKKGKRKRDERNMTITTCSSLNMGRITKNLLPTAGHLDAQNPFQTNNHLSQ